MNKIKFYGLSEKIRTGLKDNIRSCDQHLCCDLWDYKEKEK